MSIVDKQCCPISITDVTCYHRFRSDDPRYYYFHLMPANDTEGFLKDAAHPLKFSISKCIVFGKMTDCEDVFEVVPTDAGESSQVKAQCVYILN